MTLRKQCQNCEHGHPCAANVIATIRCLKDLTDHLPTESKECWQMPTDRQKLFVGAKP